MKNFILIITTLLTAIITPLKAQDFNQGVTFKPVFNTLYDLQSTSSPRNIVQNPMNRDEIHVVMTHSGYEDITFQNRVTKYFYSHDEGGFWSFIADVPLGNSSFPNISLSSNGSALVANHSLNSGQMSVNVYSDAVAGLGAFNTLNPKSQFSNYSGLWGKVLGLNTIQGVGDNKFILISADNLRPVLVGKSLTTPNFVNSNSTPDFDVAEGYSIAKSAGGKIGIAYLGSGVDMNDVFFIESTDHGNTFSTPIKIFDWVDNGSYSLGAFKTVSLVYYHNFPYVAFDVVNVNNMGSYLPDISAQLRIWSNIYPGTDPSRSREIATPFQKYIYTGTTELLASVCRPSLGVFRTTESLIHDNSLFLTYNVVTQNNINGENFTDVKLTKYLPSSMIFQGILDIKFPGQQLDYKYPNLSEYSVGKMALGMLVDSMPGSFVNGGQKSLATYYFVSLDQSKYWFWNPVTNIETEGIIADKFSLSQNYPNPFNPETSIKFSVPENVNVKLSVYDLTGKLVSVLVDKQMNQGEYRVNFNSNSLPAGTYIYKLSAGNFSETRKMVLVK
ncbi:MAG TPA: T9SS type A sorting domain-containing protein [Ignavibacteria bacterium]|nr:T9SS type A sorting domain-containing protein [Ignavibacteria bacterium]